VAPRVRPDGHEKLADPGNEYAPAFRGDLTPEVWRSDGLLRRQTQASSLRRAHRSSLVAEGARTICGRFMGIRKLGRSSPHQPAPVAGADKSNSTCVQWHNLFVADVNIDDNAVLRLRIWGHAACRALFTICVSCDRGQRYCSPEGRSEVRRRQRHDANRRYQQSELGRDPHRRRQQHYHERASQPPVTDQGTVPITSLAPPQRTTVCQCAICGRHSLWIDPFPYVPRRLRSASRSKQYAFR
jgi:hypothetical protein